MNWNSELGRTGEQLAADYLMKQHFRILHANWSIHHGYELDIVASKDNVLHFVEVKTRSHTGGIYGTPEQAVDREKYIHILRAARLYMSMYHLECKFSIDVISILYRSDNDYTLTPIFGLTDHNFA